MRYWCTYSRRDGDRPAAGVTWDATVVRPDRLHVRQIAGDDYDEWITIGDATWETMALALGLSDPHGASSVRSPVNRRLHIVRYMQLFAASPPTRGWTVRFRGQPMTYLTWDTLSPEAFECLTALDCDLIDEKVQLVIDQLDISDFADRKTKGFSQGQRTKVALARALVHEPQNIILDEPSNGLDVMAIRSLRALIRELKAAGKCVLFSSHVMQEVAALCDEIVIIAGGQVVMHDSPDGIRNSTGCDDLEEAFVRAISKVGAY